MHNWNKMSESFAQYRVYIDLCEEFDSLSPVIKPPIVNGYETILSSDPSLLVPIHTLIKGHENQNSIGMILTFKKGAHLSPTSKLKFYADSRGSKLLCELNAGTEGK
jgi:hypothetical protein